MGEHINHTTVVVNINKEDFDIYIGRGYCPKTGVKSKWGNPFTSIQDKKTLASHVVSSKEEAITKYKEYILSNEELYDSLDELEGRRLGCFCKPNDCHGDVLLQLLEQKKIKEYFKKKNNRS